MVGDDNYCDYSQAHTVPDSDVEQGTFVSVWDLGEECRSSCRFAPKTGEILYVADSEQLPEGACLREYIEDANGDEYDVCPDCHDWVLDTKTNLSGDGDVEEYFECPSCGYST